MERDDGSSRLKTFLIGGLVGASAVWAAVRKRTESETPRRSGLAAFEDAPCFREYEAREETRSGR